MEDRDSSPAQTDSPVAPLVPGPVGALAAGAFPAAVLAAINAIPGAVPLGSLAALTAAALGGSALSLAATRSRSVPGPSQPVSAQREEALSDALFHAHDQMQALRGELDALADLIVDYDLQGRVVFANDAFLAAFGQDALGRQIGDIRPVAEADRHGAAQYVTRIEDAGNRAERVFAWLDSRVQSRPGDASFIRSVGRDVTRFVQAVSELDAARGEAEEASRTKARFLAAMSHEVRTPLNGILGLANLLLDDELTPSQRNHLQAIRQSGQILAALVDEVLDFSRIEAGHIDLVEEDTSPREVVREVSELLAIRAHAKDLGLGAYVSAEVPDTVRLDSGRLRQVLTNLVANAVKFTASGAVSIRCGWKPGGGRRPGELHFEVRDTGPGIAAEDRQRIFGEFEQSTRDAGGGSGLGLAIVQRIVTAMGGDIGLESAPGSGSVFTVRLPCKAVKAAGNREKPLAGMRIAILLPREDERDCLARTCVALGARIAKRADKADIVLADPRESAAGCHAAKAIALLALTDRIEPEEIRARGFGGYLTRPVRPESLVARIAAVQVPSPAAPARASDGDRLPRSSASLRILLAEDDPVSAMLMVAMLQRMGHEVTHVSDGRAAVAKLTGNKTGYDAALLDIQLPGMSGLDIAAIVKGRAKAPALVAVTANALARDRSDSLEAGFAAHVTKPVDPQRLAAVLADVAGSGPARAGAA